MKTAYFDCFSGISGDMCLGALLDAGASFPNLVAGLRRLPVKVEVSRRSVMRGGLKALKASVSASGPQRPRRWKDIKGMIGRSALSPVVKDRAASVFKGLFETEAEVHGGAFEDVHLHELGAADALADIIGTLLCLENLGVGDVYCSAINLGGGEARSSHGTLPVPAPATAYILRGAPVYSSGPGRELTTPTGAAIIRGICSGFGDIPPMSLEAVGSGAGDRDTKERPNILRVLIGSRPPLPSEEAVVVETNIDDMDPRVYGHLMDRLLEAGALDAFLTQVIMKKGRPGVKLTVLCTEDKRAVLSALVLGETTTFGLRSYRASRTVLERRVVRKKTPFGTIRVKEALLGGRVLRATPEYEDCKKAAQRTGAPLLEIIKAAEKGP